MTDSSFVFVFEGPAFSEGEIDVRDLAPTLLALGEVVQAANRAVNGGKAEASLKLRATNEGSFEALLSVDVTWVTAMKDLWGSIAGQETTVAQANELLDLLFKAGSIATFVGGGVFAALKFLGGKRPREIRPGDDGRTTVIVSEGGHMVIDNRTVLILNDQKAREAITVFTEKTLQIPGLTGVRFDARGGENDLVLARDDLPSLEIPSEPLEELPEAVNERSLWLTIVSSSFKEGYLWRFSDGGEKPFTARVEDANFLKRIAEGEIALSPSDRLLCRVVEEQRLTTAGLSKSSRITEVIEYVRGPRQLPLV